MLTFSLMGTCTDQFSLLIFYVHIDIVDSLASNLGVTTLYARLNEAYLSMFSL